MPHAFRSGFLMMSKNPLMLISLRYTHIYATKSCKIFCISKITHCLGFGPHHVRSTSCGVYVLVMPNVAEFLWKYFSLIRLLRFVPSLAAIRLQQNNTKRVISEV